MSIDKSKMSLFFPEGFSGPDRDNLALSGVKRVQTFLGAAIAFPAQMDYLASQGVRVTLRIPEPDRGGEGASYYNLHNHGGILAQIRAVKARVVVEAVIVGNEPEGPYDLTWSSQNWGNNGDQWFSGAGGKAQAHAYALGAFCYGLKTLGVQCISPGWTHRRITPRDSPLPGRASWAELCRGAYNQCDGNGAHIYQHRLESPEDENRFLWALGGEIERCHRAVWLNEFNVNNGSQIERMRACIRMMELVNQQAWGGRVVSYCVFTSNGTGVGYAPGYILRERECYELLGSYLDDSAAEAIAA